MAKRQTENLTRAEATKTATELAAETGRQWFVIGNEICRVSTVPPPCADHTGIRVEMVSDQGAIIVITTGTSITDLQEKAYEAAQSVVIKQQEEIRRLRQLVIDGCEREAKLRKML